MLRRLKRFVWRYQTAPEPSPTCCWRRRWCRPAIRATRMRRFNSISRIMAASLRPSLSSERSRCLSPTTRLGSHTTSGSSMGCAKRECLRGERVPPHRRATLPYHPNSVSVVPRLVGSGGRSWSIQAAIPRRRMTAGSATYAARRSRRAIRLAVRPIVLAATFCSRSSHMSEVRKWLEGIGLIQYADAFEGGLAQGSR